MTLPRFFQLDVFPARRGGGNPLGVVVGAAWSDARMQAFARWLNLVETTFLSSGESPTHYRARIFTPTHEIPYAGHPTLGSAAVARAAGLVDARARALVQICGAGEVALRSDAHGQWFLRAPSASVITEGDPARARIESLLGPMALGAIPPALVDGGRRWWIAELADPLALRAWRPDHEAVRALALSSDSLGLCVFAREPAADHALVVRAFPAGVGIVEDPASGAANGLLGAYLALRDPRGPYAGGYAVSQGRELGHDARIVVRYEDDAVWVGGEARIVLRGEVEFGEEP